MWCYNTSRNKNKKMRTKTSQKKPVMIIWIFMTPIRALGKAKKFYIKGITNFSTTYNQPTMIIRDANKPPLPRSFSATTTIVSNNNQQSGDLMIRANSTSSIQIGSVERYRIQQQQHQQQQQRQQEQQLFSASRKRVPRSTSLGMGRIDEDRVSSFRNDNINGSGNKLVAKDKDSRFARNNSYGSDSRRF